MTLAAIPWLSISINLLLVVFVIVCLLMILLVLMQRPKQEGLGAAFGGGVTDQVFGARTTNVLQRGTVYLGSLFFIIALALAVLIGQKNKQFGQSERDKVEQKEVVEAPEAEEVPAETTPKSLIDELPAEEVPAEGEASAEEETPADEAETPAEEETPADEAETPAEEETPTDEAETPAEDKPAE